MGLEAPENNPVGSEGVDDLLARTMGKSHPGKHRVDRRTAREDPGVGDVEIVKVVTSPELVHHSHTRIAVHSCCAEGVVASAHEVSRSDGMTLKNPCLV